MTKHKRAALGLWQESERLYNPEVHAVFGALRGCFKMRITIIAVGKLKSLPVREIVEEYERRLPRALKVRWIEVSSPSAGSTEGLLAAEAERIRSRIPKGALLAVLGEKGREMDSREFARRLGEIRDQGQDLCFVIGGAEGVHHSLISQSHETVALSKLTFPHELVRAILAEQIYRAFTILDGGPYHRD